MVPATVLAHSGNFLWRSLSCNDEETKTADRYARVISVQNLWRKPVWTAHWKCQGYDRTKSTKSPLRAWVVDITRLPLTYCYCNATELVKQHENKCVSMCNIGTILFQSGSRFLFYRIQSHWFSRKKRDRYR